MSSNASLKDMEQHLKDPIFRLFVFATSSSMNVQGSLGCFLFLGFLAGGLDCEEVDLFFPLQLESDLGGRSNTKRIQCAFPS